jgi:hypothetical protein
MDLHIANHRLVVDENSVVAHVVYLVVVEIDLVDK